MASGGRRDDYGSIADPYCYSGTAVLINIPDIRDPDALAALETASTAQRADEPLPRGRLSVRHYRAGHPLDLDRIRPGRFLDAMVASFRGAEERLRAELARLIPQ